jgi:hypothetical protein
MLPFLTFVVWLDNDAWLVDDDAACLAVFCCYRVAILSLESVVDTVLLRRAVSVVRGAVV